ncbi:MAG: hypothetical protein R3270_11195, partial [Gammaproteobacteria bacterium]|nr:hypothetical protein [Gammaproteobacteria bacterium]
MSSMMLSLLLLAAEPAVPPVDADAANGEIAEQAPAEAERATDLSPLQEIDLLTAAGAPELALDVLGSSQPEYSSDPDGWRRHEQLRVEILRRSGNWQALAEQLADLPEGLAIADRRWTSTVRAQALLEIDQPAE